MIEALADRFHLRPSALLRGSWEDLQLDMAVLVAARAHRERRARRERFEAMKRRALMQAAGLR